jgi:hypothetical protein
MATIVTPPASIKVQIGNQQGSSVSLASSAVDIIARETAATALAQANSAYSLANTSYTIAISAYEKANTDAADSLAYAIALG